MMTLIGRVGRRVLRELPVIAAMAVCQCNAAPVHRVAEIRTRLFIQSTGQLSTPITDKIMLWNAVAGGASDAGESASSALVDVVLASVDSEKTGSPLTTIELLVTDQLSGRVVERMTARAHNVGVEYHVAFGCETSAVVHSS